jgi:hypothetical protein
LWSIVCGPLVNAILVLPLVGMCVALHVNPLTKMDDVPDEHRFIAILTLINFGLLFLNLLPIYPLDGGQILHALLWFVFGRWLSLLIVSIIGGIGGVLVFLLSAALAAATREVGAFFLGFIAAFIALRSLVAFQAAQQMLRLERLPRHHGCVCPGCGVSPPRGQLWVCEHCQSRFDTFATHGKCPSCGAWFLETACPHCHSAHHIDAWYVPEEVYDPIIVETPGEPKA